MKRTIIFLLCSTLLLCPIFSSCGMFDNAVWLAMDCAAYSVGGKLQETAAPPLCIGGVGYISAEDFIALFPKESKAANLSADSPAENAVTENGHVYLPINELCAMCDIPVANLGGLFALGRTKAIDTETYIEKTAALGFEGFYDSLSFGWTEYCVDPYVRIGYEQVRTDLDELCAMYPGLITQTVFGETVEGRELMTVTLGRGPREIMLAAAIHGSEYYTTNFILYVMDRYAYAYANDLTIEGLSVREILDAVTFVIVPQLNPDGVNIAQNGGSAAKNPSFIYSCDMQGTWFGGWKANANGVDLNRNFPNRWCQENGINWPCARYFCGYAAATEPEVISILNLMEATPFYAFADFHTFGEVIFWYDTQNPQHEEKYGDTVGRLLDLTGFRDFGMETVEKFAGYMSNYARNDRDCLSMTVELCSTWRLRGQEELFDISAEAPFPLPLVLADEVLSFPHNGTLSATLNGRRIDLASSAKVSTFTEADIEVLFAACGIALHNDDGVITLTQGEQTYTVKPVSEHTAPQPECVAFDLTDAFSVFGVCFEMTDDFSVALYDVK